MVRNLFWVLAVAAFALASAAGLILAVGYASHLLPHGEHAGALVSTGIWVVLLTAAAGAGGLTFLHCAFGAALATAETEAAPAVGGIEISGPVRRAFRRCPVCKSSGVRRELAWCARCLTPHHADCWHYAGKCAVFGCGGTRARFADPPLR